MRQSQVAHIHRAYAGISLSSQLVWSGATRLLDSPFLIMYQRVEKLESRWLPSNLPISESRLEATSLQTTHSKRYAIGIGWKGFSTRWYMSRRARCSTMSRLCCRRLAAISSMSSRRPASLRTSATSPPSTRSTASSFPLIRQHVALFRLAWRRRGESRSR
jgi:hypothetical protein